MKSTTFIFTMLTKRVQLKFIDLQLFGWIEVIVTHGHSFSASQILNTQTDTTSTTHTQVSTVAHGNCLRRKSLMHPCGPMGFLRCFSTVDFPNAFKNMQMCNVSTAQPIQLEIVWNGKTVQTNAIFPFETLSCLQGIYICIVWTLWRRFFFRHFQFCSALWSLR